MQPGRPGNSFPMLSKLSPPFPEDAMALLLESARVFEVAALLSLPSSLSSLVHSRSHDILPKFFAFVSKFS